MTKSELITKLSEESNLNKTQANDCLNALSKIITEALVNGDKVLLPDVGTFLAKERSARTVRNPRTGETMQTAACKVGSFKFSKHVKDELNK